MHVNLGDVKLGTKERSRVKGLLAVDMRSYTIVLALVVLWIVLSLLSDGAFFTPAIYRTFLGRVP